MEPDGATGAEAGIADRAIGGDHVLLSFLNAFVVATDARRHGRVRARGEVRRRAAGEYSQRGWHRSL